MTAKIIVGVDGSETSGSALVWASRLAAQHDAVVDPVLTWHFPATAPTVLGDALMIPPLDEMEDAAMAQLAVFLDQYRDQCDPGTTVSDGSIVEGAAGPVLCNLATSADLLVVGSRGYGGFKGLLLGSVSAYCADHSPSPVALVPPEWELDGLRGKVVVGIDGSDNADAAVRWADHWAHPGVTLRVVHTWEYPVAYNAQAVVVDAAVLEEGANQVLAEAVARVTAHAVHPVCVRGDARRELNEEASDADMLVLGARGRSGITRLLLGSVASTIVHHLVVPTVLVRAPQSDD